MSAPLDISKTGAPPLPDTLDSTPSPWRLTLTIVSIGMGGLLVMFTLLAQHPFTSPVMDAVAGSLFMLGLMTPVIYLILLRPMRRELRSQAETTRVLREIRAGLEDRVRERTAELERANLQVQQSLRALERSHRETTLISELMELLQACGTAPEAQKVMERFGPKLFPEERGAIYLYRPSRNVLELATGWRGEGQQVTMFPPDACWALRRGREFLSEGGRQSVFCQHFSRAESDSASAICVPMMAHGETTGLLVLEGAGTGIPEATQRLAGVAAERIGLALANLQLREKLRDQAIRDPLTAMYNRRYFEETAARELLRAGEDGSSVGLIMIDVDQFKRFNDSNGHEAGDAVLQRVALTLQSHSRVEDVVCRYGGEEFVMLLPGLPADASVKRAEGLREAIRDLTVRFHGETLAAISISCGVSMFPGQGRTCAELIDAADHALYRAKQAGRNRVELAA